MRDNSKRSTGNTTFRPLYLLRGLFVVAVTTVVYVSLLPDDSLIQTQLWDKLEHFLAYALLAAIGSAAFPTSSALRPVGLGLCALGIGLEVAQTQVRGRSGDPIDALANGLGVLFGLAIARILRGPT
jgi:VanZ family protein